MKRILFNPTPTDGGGGGQGNPGDTAPAGTPTTPPVVETKPDTRPTAEKLWGGLMEEKKTAPEKVEEKPVVEKEKPAAAAPPVNNQTISAETLAEITKSVAAGMKPEEKPPTMSQEDFEKTFNIFKPNAELVAQLGHDDPAQRIQAIQAIVNGAAKQATTLASYLLESKLAQMQEQYKPALTMAQEREMEQMKTEFFTQNKDLVGLDPILLQIRDSFIAKGIKFPSKEKAFKAVADEARKLLEKFPGLKNGAATDAGKTATTPTTPATKMPTLSGKGTGGVGDTPAAGAQNTAQRIFGGSTRS